MSDLPFLSALLAFFIVAASPGPATLSAAFTSMARGRAAGVAHGMGLALGLFVWGVVAALGVGSLIVGMASALVVLKIAGGLYLLWLAFKSAKSAMSPVGLGPADQPTSTSFRAGLMLNLANPKAVFAWLAVIAIGLPTSATPALAMAVTLACGLLGVAIYWVIAIVFSHPSAMGVYAKFRRWIDGAFAALFGLAGLRLLTGRLT